MASSMEHSDSVGVVVVLDLIVVKATEKRWDLESAAELEGGDLLEEKALGLDDSLYQPLAEQRWAKKDVTEKGED